MLLRPNLQRLSPDIARASLDYSLAGFIFLFDVTKSKSWSVLDLIWKENTPKRKQRYLDSKFSLQSCEGKKMVREVMEKQQAKFVYLDMPDFGLDVLLVQPRSYEIFKCFRHKSSSPSHWENTQCFQSVCSILGKFPVRDLWKFLLVESHILLAGLYPKAFLLSSLTFFGILPTTKNCIKHCSDSKWIWVLNFLLVLEAVQHKEPGEFVQAVWAALSSE